MDIRTYMEVNECGMIEAREALAKEYKENRQLILIAKLSGLKGIAKGRGELTLFALIDAMLEHEVNS